MNKKDFNCFVGGWPFHKVRNNSFNALRELHKKNNIIGGYVSSTNAIFYNDPYEAELDLSLELTDTAYHHVMTVNPTLPGCFNALARGVRDLHIKGVRLLPGFHGYSLDCIEVSKLCEALRKYCLPLFITLRMEDERVTHMFYPKTVSLDELKCFLNTQSGLPILLSNIRRNELLGLRDCLLNRKDVYADCSGLKDTITVMEKLDEEGITSRMVYGSLAPLFCLKSSLLVVEKGNILIEVKEKILSGAGFLAEINNADKTEQLHDEKILQTV